MFDIRDHGGSYAGGKSSGENIFAFKNATTNASLNRKYDIKTIGNKQITRAFVPTDMGNAIQEDTLDENGTILSTKTITTGTTGKTFSNFHALRVNKHGLYCVWNSYNGTYQLYDKNGTMIAQFGGANSPAAYTGLGVDADLNLIFYCDNSGSSAYVRNAAGTIIASQSFISNATSYQNIRFAFMNKEQAIVLCASTTENGIMSFYKLPTVDPTKWYVNNFGSSGPIISQDIVMSLLNAGRSDY